MPKPKTAVPVEIWRHDCRQTLTVRREGEDSIRFFLNGSYRAICPGCGAALPKEAEALEAPEWRRVEERRP